MPLAIQSLVLPFVVPDREPFHFQPSVTLGCPNWLYHIVAVYSVFCSIVVWNSKDVYITIALEQVRGWRPAQPKMCNVPIAVYFDSLPLACAALSLVYLLVVARLPDGSEPDGLGLRHFSAALYHVCWAFLRPTYALLFALYWLKRQERGVFWQSLLCGFGGLYFVAVCMLSTTKAGSNTVAEASQESHMEWTATDSCGGLIVGSPTGLQPPLGATVHFEEALSFYISWLMFMVHGIESGAWVDPGASANGASGGRTLVRVVSVGMLIVWVLLSADTVLGTALSLSGKNAYYSFWLPIHYGLGYGLIITTQTYVLMYKRRHILLFTTTTTTEDQ